MEKSRFKISQNGFSKGAKPISRFLEIPPCTVKTASGFLEMGLQGCDGGASFLCLIIQKHDLCGRIENNVEAFRYTVLIHISRMTSATSARASRIKSSGAIRICKPRCPALT